MTNIMRDWEVEVQLAPAKDKKDLLSKELQQFRVQMELVLGTSTFALSRDLNPNHLLVFRNSGVDIYSRDKDGMLFCMSIGARLEINHFIYLNIFPYPKTSTVICKGEFKTGYEFHRKIRFYYDSINNAIVFQNIFVNIRDGFHNYSDKQQGFKKCLISTLYQKSFCHHTNFNKCLKFVSILRHSVIGKNQKTFGMSVFAKLCWKYFDRVLENTEILDTLVQEFAGREPFALPVGGVIAYPLHDVNYLLRSVASEFDLSLPSIPIQYGPSQVSKIVIVPHENGVPLLKMDWFKLFVNTTLFYVAKCYWVDWETLNLLHLKECHCTKSVSFMEALTESYVDV